MAWFKFAGQSKDKGFDCARCGHHIPAAHSYIKHFNEASNTQQVAMLCSPCTTLLEQWLGGFKAQNQ